MLLFLQQIPYKTATYRRKVVFRAGLLADDEVPLVNSCEGEVWVEVCYMNL